jgi:HEAT repeat protein
MFGNGKNPFEHLVTKNKWEKIQGKLDHANVQTRLEIASACSLSSEDESMNILIRLLTDSDEGVQLQAVKSLGVSGRPNAKTHLHWLSEHLPAEGKDELKQAIREASAAITKRQ